MLPANAACEAFAYGKAARNPRPGKRPRARIPLVRSDPDSADGATSPGDLVLQNFAESAWSAVSVLPLARFSRPLAATTGMRRSELAGVERDMLDLDQGTVTIENTPIVVKGHATDSDGRRRAAVVPSHSTLFTVAAHVG